MTELQRRSSLIHEDTREVLLQRPDVFGVSAAALEAGWVRVCKSDGRIVGYATLIARDAESMELEDLFVDPDHMRRGIGRALMLDAVATARRRGARRIVVTANPNAMAFYAAVGFVARHETPTEFGPGWRMSFEL